MNLDNLKQFIKKHEDLKLKPYLDTKGKLTIGIGRNLDDKGISVTEAYIMLESDIVEAINDLRTIFANFSTLSENRQMVLIDMRFQLGPNRFRGFKDFIKAVQEEDFTRSGEEIKNSLYYSQVTNRAEENIKLIVEG